MTKTTELDNYLANRNAALTSLDLEWAKKQMPGASETVLECAMHKARYECTAIDRQLRRDSAAWLRKNNFGGLTGPLLPEGELPE